VVLFDKNKGGQDTQTPPACAFFQGVCPFGHLIRKIPCKGNNPCKGNTLPYHFKDKPLPHKNKKIKNEINKISEGKC
jgi:hypothetical protein